MGPCSLLVDLVGEAKWQAALDNLYPFVCTLKITDMGVGIDQLLKQGFTILLSPSRECTKPADEQGVGKISYLCDIEYFINQVYFISFKTFKNRMFLV
ncbi:hypothetical protein [Desulforhopalus sp. 52FAK]